MGMALVRFRQGLCSVFSVIVTGIFPLVMSFVISIYIWIVQYYMCLYAQNNNSHVSEN